MKRVVRNDAIVFACRKIDSIQIARQKRGGHLEPRRIGGRDGPFYPLLAQVNPCHLKPLCGKFKGKAPFSAAELQDARTACCGANEETVVFLAEEDVKEYRIIPYLRVFRILPDLTPVEGLPCEQIFVLLRVIHVIDSLVVIVRAT